MGKLYIIPNAACITESLALAEKYDAHFEYNDFYLPGVLDDEKRVNELIAFYASLPGDRSKNTLHGAFFDVTIHSADPEIKAVSDKRIRQSMEIARRLGVGAVIFHTNLIANFKNNFYIDTWVKENAAYWRALSADYPGVSIYIENMFDEDFRPITALMEALSDVKDVSACFDYAHAALFGSDMEAWLRALLPYAAHLHINDNDGVADLHYALGKGVMDYDLLNREIARLGARPTVLLEMTDVSAQELSIEYLRENGIYPFERRAEKW
jgi:sugar phosphate isomerase/epimerase